MKSVKAKRILSWIKPYAQHRYASVALFVFSLTATLFETIPVTWVLSAFVLLQPFKWKRYVWVAALGSALGAFLLAWAAHRWGYSWIATRYPAWVESEAWLSTRAWVDRYGVVALGIIAALPLALTPAIILCGLMKMPVGSVFLAILLGKLVKYVSVSFPVRFAAKSVLIQTEGSRTS